jgi:CheY-like chemotaxis protein
MSGRAEPSRVDVLIAEHDALQRRGLRLLLEQWGYACDEAGDGREALDRAWRAPPRCVLLDLAMPRLDGFAVARALRRDPRTRAAYIHCLTGQADAQTRLRALEAGCDRFLVKPVDVAELRRAIDEAGPAREPGAVSGLTLRQAEELLDWLQNNDGTTLGVAMDGGGVTVRFVLAPGLRVPGGRL